MSLDHLDLDAAYPLADGETDKTLRHWTAADLRDLAAADSHPPDSRSLRLAALLEEHGAHTLGDLAEVQP